MSVTEQMIEEAEDSSYRAGARTAFDLVIAHLKSAEATWQGNDVDPAAVLRLAQSNVMAMRGWTDEEFDIAIAALGE